MPLICIRHLHKSPRPRYLVCLFAGVGLFLLLFRYLPRLAYRVSLSLFFWPVPHLWNTIFFPLSGHLYLYREQREAHQHSFITRRYRGFTGFFSFSFYLLLLVGDRVICVSVPTRKLKKKPATNKLQQQDASLYSAAILFPTNKSPNWSCCRFPTEFSSRWLPFLFSARLSERSYAVICFLFCVASL